MSIPDHSKKATHQVIHMGYNTRLIKILIGLNILLILIFGIIALKQFNYKSHINQKLNMLSQKIYELQWRLSNQSPQRRFHENIPFDYSNFEKHIQQVHEHLQTYQSQVKTLQRESKYIKSMLNQLKEQNQNQWTSIRKDEDKLSKVQQILNKIGQSLKPVTDYFQTFEVLNMNSFKNKFSQTFADWKAKFKNAFTNQNDQKRSGNPRDEKYNDL